MRRAFIISILYAGALFMFPFAAGAQTFKASHLQRAYEKLHLNSASANHPGLTIRTSEDGMIEHIGIPLFSTKMRTLLPSPIYDYLEFALLDHKYHINENTLQRQKIRFRNGSWADLESVTPSDDCTIDNRDDKWYIVRWDRHDKAPLVVVVPIEYELLANSNRKEMEQNFCRDLQHYRPSNEGHAKSAPSINADNPEEALSNILMTKSSGGVAVDLSLELLFAGYTKKVVSVSLPQWMGYCRSVGCTPYYMYEGTTGGQAAAVLLMYNRSEGYAHLLSLRAVASQLALPHQNYIGKVYMYIPTTNVAELFATTTGQSTPKHYE